MYADVEEDYFSFNKIPRILFKDRQRCVVYMYMYLYMYMYITLYMYSMYTGWSPIQASVIIYCVTLPSCIVMHEYMYIYMYVYVYNVDVQCIFLHCSGLMCEVRAEASTVRALLYMFRVNVVCS